ncbi:hypothetical protein H5T88_02095 [bacterium]|nr:hypothetical protein [bacterium]
MELLERFNNPPMDARILKIVHSLPDTPEAQDSLFSGLLSQGFGGVVCNVSFADYLESEEKWAAFVRGVKKAKELGMALWLYDEKGYPSGTAGGLTLKDHPEWEARGLLCAEGETSEEGVVLEAPPGKLLGAWAFPKRKDGIDLKGRIDLTDKVKDGKLSWKPEKGDWHVIILSENRLYDKTHAAISLGDRLPYINLLMPEPTRRFIELTHERYAKHLGDDLGKYFIATFTDEPSLMSYFFLPASYSPLPWAPNLPNEFRKRRGYEIEPFLPLLFLDGKEAGKVRYDFWQTVGELVAENFFGQIRDWCRRHNIASGGHLLMEESLTAHVSFYGNFFLCLKYLDAPSIDCLTSIPSEVPWRIARFIGSVRDLNKNIYTMCETSDFIQVYRPEGDKRPVRVVTEEEIRGTCNRLIHGGVNTITSYYTFQKLSTEQLQRLNLWVGRCAGMMRGGQQVTDIAVLYPVESLWVHFRPAKRGATDSPSALRIEEIFNQVSDVLYNSNRDFLYIDTPTLLNATLNKGSLVFNGLSWRILILPCVDTLPLDAWRKIESFWREGGVVIAIGALPTNSEREFPSYYVKRIANSLFANGEKVSIKRNEKGGVAVYLPVGSASILPTILDKIIEQDVKIKEESSPLRITHRKIEGWDIYFIINDSDKACKNSLSFRGKGEGKLLDPMDGSTKTIEKVEWVEIEFAPYDAKIVVFPEVEKTKRLQPTENERALLNIKKLQHAGQLLGKGEFVQGGFERAKVSGQDGFKTKARLSRSNVDCFLFLSFIYSGEVDLSKASHLYFQISIPKEQKSPAHMFVILRDMEGNESIANTGILLSDGGERELFVPLSGFSPTPWGKGKPADLTKISTISIGWGGYYGEEGEELQFSTTPPQILMKP